MKLKDKKKLLYGILVLMLVSLFLMGVFSGTAQLICMIISAVSLVALCVLCPLLWRCPKCHRYLGRIDDCGQYCKHCGEELFK